MADLHGDEVVLRPLAEGDAEELRRIHSTAEVSAWWGKPEAEFPHTDDPEATRYTILVDGEVGGLVQYLEEPEADYRNAEIDIFLDPRHHGRGLGGDALRTMVRHMLEDRGHHRVIIVPAAANHRAIRSYEQAGFSPVGITRLSARHPLSGEWHDELLMELVVEPPAAG